MCVANALHINVVAACGDNEADAFGGQSMQGATSMGGDLVLIVQQGTIEIGYDDFKHADL